MISSPSPPLLLQGLYLRRDAAAGQAGKRTTAPPASTSSTAAAKKDAKQQPDSASKPEEKSLWSRLFGGDYTPPLPPLLFPADVALLTPRVPPGRRRHLSLSCTTAPKNDSDDESDDEGDSSKAGKKTETITTTYPAAASTAARAPSASQPPAAASAVHSPGAQPPRGSCVHAWSTYVLTCLSPSMRRRPTSGTRPRLRPPRLGGR